MSWFSRRLRIVDCGQGLDRAVLEARTKFEAEEAENRKRHVEDAVSALRVQQTAELQEAVDMSIAEN